MSRLKCCNTCKTSKPLDMFYSYYCSEREKMRVNADCIECKNEKRGEYRRRKTRGLSNNARYERSPNRRYSSARGLAKRRGYEFSLSKTEFLALISLPCHYCGGALPVTRGGLDRVDNSKGYTFDNVVPCCSDCNRIKCHLLTHEEMYAVAQLLQAMRGKAAA